MSASMAFDGNSHVYQTTAIYDTLVPDFPVTIAGWVYINNTASGLEFAFSLMTSSLSDFFLVTFDGSNLYSWIRGTGDFKGTAQSYSTGQWMHLAATATSSTQTLYIDGVQAYADSHTAVWGDPDHIAIAGRPSTSTASRFDGKIAYVQVYDVALTIDEVQEIMNAPYKLLDGCVFHAPGLYGSYSSATDIKDLSKFGNAMEAGTAPAASPLGPPIYIPKL